MTLYSMIATCHRKLCRCHQGSAERPLFRHSTSSAECLASLARVLLLCSCCLRTGASIEVVPAGCMPVNGSSAWSPAQLLDQAQLANGANTAAASSEPAAVSRLLCLSPGTPVRVLGSGPYAQGVQVSGVLHMRGAAAAPTGPLTSTQAGAQGAATEAALDMTAYASTASAAFTATTGMLHASSPCGIPCCEGGLNWRAKQHQNKVRPTAAGVMPTSMLLAHMPAPA